MDKKDQSIKCDVSGCVYNDCKNKCVLDGIYVSCLCDKEDASKVETICDSFEKRV